MSNATDRRSRLGRPAATSLTAEIVAPAALLVAVALLAPTPLAGPDSAAAAEGKGKGKGGKSRSAVTVRTTGNRSEKFRTLPVTDQAWQRPRVVMALKRRQIPKLSDGDRLRTSVELQLTNDCIRREPRCVGSTYRYSPKVDVRLELTADDDAIPRKATVLARGQERCGQDEPHRERHCVLVMRASESRLREKKTACAPEKCRINLVASAHHRNSGSGDLIMLGGNRRDGSIPQDRGRINLTHIRAGGEPRSSKRTSRRLRKKSQKMDLRRRSVLSVPLKNLRAGDQLEIEARVRSTISHLPYTARQTSHLVLGSKPGTTKPDRRARRVGSLGGEIDESNGFNCPLPRGACTSRKVGVMEIRETPGRKMYANLVLLLGPKRATARSGDAAKLDRGKLKVRRYAAPRGKG